MANHRTGTKFHKQLHQRTRLGDVAVFCDPLARTRILAAVFIPSAYYTLAIASLITFNISSGFDNIGKWLVSSSVILAQILLAMMS